MLLRQSLLKPNFTIPFKSMTSEGNLEVEEFENVPLVRMEDVQPSRAAVKVKEGDELNIPNVVSTDFITKDEEMDYTLIFEDDESNIGSMVSVKTENDLESELIVPDVLEASKPSVKEKNRLPMLPSVTGITNSKTTSWPTLEILPGGVINLSDNRTPPLNEENLMYACAKCPKRFSQLFLLSQHVRSHAGKSLLSLGTNKIRLENLQERSRALDKQFAAVTRGKTNASTKARRQKLKATRKNHKCIPPKAEALEQGTQRVSYTPQVRGQLIHPIKVLPSPDDTVPPMKVNNFTTMNKVVNFKADNVNSPTMNKVSNITTMNKVKNVATMNKVDTVTTMIKVDNVAIMNKVDTVTTMIKVDNVAIMNKADNVATVNKLDNVTTLSKVNSVSAVNEMENVTTVRKVDSVTELNELNEVTTVNKVDNVRTVSTVDNITTVNTVDSVTAVNTVDNVTTVNTVDNVTAENEVDNVITRKKVGSLTTMNTVGDETTINEVYIVTPKNKMSNAGCGCKVSCFGNCSCCKEGVQCLAGLCSCICIARELRMKQEKAKEKANAQIQRVKKGKYVYLDGSNIKLHQGRIPNVKVTKKKS